jgi:Glycosyltransferase
MKKQIILFASIMDRANLNKVLFLLPYYLKKVFDCEAKIYVAKKTKDVPDEWRGIPIIQASNFDQLIQSQHIWCDLYISFGYGKMTPVYPRALKAINPQCVTCYVTDHAPDISPLIKPAFGYRFSYLMKKIVKFPILLERFPKERKLGKQMYRAFDFYFTETESAYKDILKHKWLHVDVSKKLSILDMGYDDESLAPIDECLHMNVPRHNVFLFTGIVGGLFKNSRLVLQVLPLVHWKDDWSIVMAGPVRPGFQEKFDSLIRRRPDLAKRISLIGNVTSRSALFQLYRSSKVFFLTSDRESSCYSLVEAALLGDYILSTPVGIAPELTQNGVHGSLYPGRNPRALAQFMDNIMIEKVSLEDGAAYSAKMVRDQFSYSAIVSRCSVFKDHLLAK